MLTRPEIFSNETERGYLGRLMRLNGKNDQKEFFRLATNWFSQIDNNKQDYLPIEVLSKASGLNLQQFICQHTTLPFRRAITAYSPEITHGNKKCRSMLQNSSMRSARQGAYFCKECANEELKSHGFSYWHRNLQIPGLLWCPEHQTALHYIEDEKSFLFSPLKFSKSHQATNTNRIIKFQSSEVINKFLNISDAMMSRKTPLNSRYVSHALKQRALSLKLRNYGGKRNSPLLSDLVYKSFNKEWLKKTFPVMQDKVKGSAMSQLDGIFYGKKVSPPVTAFILAASVLYDTAENALDDIVSARIKKDCNKSCDPIYRTRMDDSELKKSYIRNGGDHSAVVSDIQRKKISVTSRLNSLGLPNLADRNGINQKFITAFLIDGKSLDESMYIADINEKTMERILRTLGNSFVQTMKDINKAATKK